MWPPLTASYRGRVGESTTREASEFAAYFAFMEVSGLLQHAVEQQLRGEGGLSLVQFQILARLTESPGGHARLTDLADGVVYSRSALTYQSRQLEQSGLVRRKPSTDDERSTTVIITDEGRAVVARVMPGHVELVRRVMFEPLATPEVVALRRIMTRVRDRMRSAPSRSASTPRTTGRATGPV